MIGKSPFYFVTASYIHFVIHPTCYTVYTCIHNKKFSLWKVQSCHSSPSTGYLISCTDVTASLSIQRYYSCSTVTTFSAFNFSLISLSKRLLSSLNCTHSISLLKGFCSILFSCSISITSLSCSST